MRGFLKRRVFLCVAQDGFSEREPTEPLPPRTLEDLRLMYDHCFPEMHALPQVRALRGRRHAGWVHALLSRACQGALLFSGTSAGMQRMTHFSVRPETSCLFEKSSSKGWFEHNGDGRCMENYLQYRSQIGLFFRIQPAGSNT